MTDEDKRHLAKRYTDFLKMTDDRHSELLRVEAAGATSGADYRTGTVYMILRAAYDAEHAREQSLLTRIRSVAAKLALETPLSAEEQATSEEFTRATHRSLAIQSGLRREMEFLRAEVAAGRAIE